MSVTLPAGLLNQTAIVYTRAASGSYSTVANSALACLILKVSPRAATSGMGRSELTARRRLMWDPAYTLPAEARLLVDGVTWQVQRGTHGTYRDHITGAAIYRAAEIERVT